MFMMVLINEKVVVLRSVSTTVQPKSRGTVASCAMLRKGLAERFFLVDFESFATLVAVEAAAAFGVVARCRRGAIIA